MFERVRLLKLRWKLLIGGSVAALAIFGVLIAAGNRISNRFEPYIRERTIQYLSRRFDSQVEIGSLRLNAPRVSALRLFFSEGRGLVGKVTLENIVMRHKGRRDIPPMFSIAAVHFEVDLGRMFEPKKSVALIQLEHMELVIPPKAERPVLAAPVGDNPPLPAARDLFIERVVIRNSRLTVLPRNKSRVPLEFDLRRVTLESLRLNEALTYDADLTNPKPPGIVKATGNFGPWNAEHPSDTPLSGASTFSDADLSVFPAIAGTLHSVGKFTGTLTDIQASGTAEVPDFRLKMSGNPMPLSTSFEAAIDGTNGNTILKPVRAKLNTTTFTTSGAVVKHEGDTKRTIELDVQMPKGELHDLLRLVMKASPAMAGQIQMTSKITIPPVQGRVREKLILDGQFSIDRGRFLREGIQDKVDELSRRAQAHPGDLTIDNVFSKMAGAFHLDGQNLTFHRLSFQVPGAEVELAGDFDMTADALDLQGKLRLDAKVSQTMTGWKRWALKPVDPIFARDGAGTLLKIKVGGSSKEPRFGASR